MRQYRGTFLLILILFSLTCLYSKSAIDWYNEARKYYFLEEYNNAIISLKESLNINPNFEEPIKLLAEIYYLNGEYNYAFIYINRALKLAKNNYETLLFTADIESKLGRFTDAESKYREILQYDPLNNSARNGLADIYLSSGKSHLAKRTIDEVLSGDLKNYKANMLLAKYFEKIDQKKANEYYEYNIKFNSLNSDAFYDYAIFLYKTKNYHKSLEMIQTALKISKRDIYNTMYAKVLLVLNRPDESLNIFRGLLNKESDYLIFYHIGICYNMQGNFQKAIEALKKSLNLRSDNEIVARLYDILIIDNLQITNRSILDRGEYYYDFAMSNKKSANFDLYLYYLKESLRINPSGVIPRIELANYYLSKKYPERYINELKIASQYTNDKNIKDKIEVESTRISYKLGDSWGLNQYRTPNTIYTIPLFINYDINNRHFRFESYAASIFKTASIDYPGFIVELFDEKEYTRQEKAIIASENSCPFYIDFFATENDNSVNLKIKLYNRVNFEQIVEHSAMRQGNNRVVLSAKNLAAEFAKFIPFRSKIVKISNNRAIINAGRYNNLKLKDRLLVIQNKNYPIEFKRSRFIYNKEDIKGYATIIKLDENISEVLLSEQGFFKKINIDDILIIE